MTSGEQEVSHFACDFNGVKLSKPADAVALDPQPESIEDDELARSSPDDRGNQRSMRFVNLLPKNCWRTCFRFRRRVFEMIVCWVICTARDMAVIAVIYGASGVGDGGIDGIISR